MDFEVLLYTNTFPDGEAAVGGQQAYRDAIAPLFTRRWPAGSEPLRAVINVDGEACQAGLVLRAGRRRSAAKWLLAAWKRCRVTIA